MSVNVKRRSGLMLNVLPCAVRCQSADDLRVERVEFRFSGSIRFRRVLDIIKPTKVFLFPAPLNMGLPLKAVFAPRYSGVTGLIVCLNSLVLVVFKRLAFSKIFNPVVAPDAVNMVDLFGERTMMKNPDQLVLGEARIEELANPVTVLNKAAPAGSNGYPFLSLLPEKTAVSVFKPFMYAILPVLGAMRVFIHSGERTSASDRMQHVKC